MTAGLYTASRKSELLVAVDAGETIPLLDPRADYLQLPQWAHERGLPAPLMLLAAALAVSIPGQHADRQFVRDLLAAIPAGGQCDGVTHRWVGWVWRESEPPVRSQLTIPAVLDASQAIISLHDRAAEGEQIAPTAWKALRTALNRALAAAPYGVTEAASVIGASAWDFNSVPGAAADILTAWENAAFAKIRRTEVGSEEQDDRYRELRKQARVTAAERAGPKPDSTDQRAMTAYTRRLDDEFGNAVSEIDGPLYEQMTARAQRLIDAAITVRKQAKSALLRLSRPTAPA
jgi:hypothetical protein